MLMWGLRLLGALTLVRQTEATEAYLSEQIQLVYEESFAIIMVITNSTPIRHSSLEMKKKATKMGQTALHFHLGGENHLQKAIAKELVSYAENIEEGLDSILRIRDMKGERAIELIGDVINAISGVPGPRQYRKQQEAFKKIQGLMQVSVAK